MGSTWSLSSTQSAGLFEFTTVIRSRSKLRPAAINLAGVPVDEESSSSSSSTETREGSFFNSSLTAIIVASKIRFSDALNCEKWIGVVDGVFEIVLGEEGKL